MSKKVYVGAASIDKEKSSERAVKFVEEVSKGLHQGEKLSKAKFDALKKMARELLDTKNIDEDSYKMILDKLEEMTK